MKKQEDANAGGAANPKTCFVIAPIGKDGSEVRHRSDQLLKYLFRPAAEECGYLAVRADEISEPGLITSQVIQHVVDDHLVIADLTGWNPNVFYELALRHVLRKPIVQIIAAGEAMPFDVAASRTIMVNHQDLDSVAKAKDEMIRQIRHCEKAPGEVDTPISVSIDLDRLRRSENPLEKSAAEIIKMLQELGARVSDIGQLLTPPFPDGSLGALGGANPDLRSPRGLWRTEAANKERDLAERTRHFERLAYRASKGLDDPNPAGRISACLELGRLGRYAEKYVADLERLEHSEADETVTAVALNAIRDIKDAVATHRLR
jgi:hypothetical protein